MEVAPLYQKGIYNAKRNQRNKAGWRPYSTLRWYKPNRAPAPEISSIEIRICYTKEELENQTISEIEKRCQKAFTLRYQ